jgi:hypothetical protein
MTGELYKDLHHMQNVFIKQKFQPSPPQTKTVILQHMKLDLNSAMLILEESMKLTYKVCL